MNPGPAGSLGRVEPAVFAFAASTRDPRLFCSPADSLCSCTVSCLPMGISQRPERPFRCLIYRAKLSNVETCDARHIPPVVLHVLSRGAQNVPGSRYSSLCRAQRRMRKITLDEIPALQSTTGERIMMPLSMRPAGGPKAPPRRRTSQGRAGSEGMPAHHLRAAAHRAAAPAAASAAVPPHTASPDPRRNCRRRPLAGPPCGSLTAIPCRTTSCGGAQHPAPKRPAPRQKPGRKGRLPLPAIARRGQCPPHVPERCPPPLWPGAGIPGSARLRAAASRSNILV